MDDAKRPRTVRQGANELGLSEYTMRAWISSRRIGYMRLGRSIRIPAEEIARLLAKGFIPARRQD